MSTRLSTRRFNTWWQLAREYFKREYDSLVAVVRGANAEATNTAILQAIEDIDVPESAAVEQREVVYAANYAALQLIASPSEEVLYITEDTGYMYKYRDGEFVLIEDEEEIDNTIYYSSSKSREQMFTALKKYTSIGEWDIVHIYRVPNTSPAEYLTYIYRLIVSGKSNRIQQKLIEDDLQESSTRYRTARVKTSGTGYSWTNWTLRTQVYKEDLDASTASVKGENDKSISDVYGEVEGMGTAMRAMAMEQTLSDGIDAIRGDISGISVDTSDLAKEETIGAATDTAAETTSSSLFAWVKKIRDYLYGIVTTSPYAKEATLGTSSDSSSANTIFGKLATILAAFSGISIDTSTLALKDATEKTENSTRKTTIGELTDSAHGLGVIATAASSAASDAAAAKQAAQAITIPSDYAKSGGANAPTMAELGTAIAAIPTTTPSGWATSANVSDAKEAIMGGGSGTGKSVKDVYEAIPSVASIQSGLATESNATANKNAILQAISDNAGVPTLTIPNTTASQELAPNTLYIFTSRTSNLTLTLGTLITGVANEYHCYIAASSAITITWPSGISWNGGSAPTIAANKTYEISILNNVAAYFEV